MASALERDKPKNRKHYQGQQADASKTTTATSTSQFFKKSQDDNDNNSTSATRTREIKRRRPTKVGLNDMLRRIRNLVSERSDQATAYS